MRILPTSSLSGEQVQDHQRFLSFWINFPIMFSNKGVGEECYWGKSVVLVQHILKMIHSKIQKQREDNKICYCA